MNELSDFKPLERMVLPGIGELDCSGLILVVGPNSSGKTQLLRDLYHRLKGDHRDLVVARELDLRKPE
jgi:Ni2+-binding GTPase involved in maturation of urease and hydrogenase